MDGELQRSYRHAEAVARSRARNFYYAFAVLPPEKKRAFCAAYAFMRHCDDISDGADAPERKRELLGSWRELLRAAYAGQFDGNPIVPAFHHAVCRFAIPEQYFHWIIDGAEMDLTVPAYETFQDLYRYCFNVAAAVGLVSLHIFGFSDESAKQPAEHCGIAFQLTNILRDIQEDSRMGRIYLPAEDLRRFEYTADELRAGVMDDRFQALMRFETDRAREYYRQAIPLLSLIDEDSRPAYWAMAEIYRGILEKLVRRRFDVFGPRVRLSRVEKISIAARAAVMRIRRTTGRSGRG